ncbi:DUF2878 domain-containing protein [Thalassotalea ganghwensis]
MKKLVNFGFFYLIWFACVLYGNAAVPFVLLAVTLHLFKFGDRQEVMLVMAITILGIIVDSFLMFFDVFVFAEQVLVIPLWLIAIWMAFACTLRHSLSFFYSLPQWQILAGAIAGPLSYYSGYLLNAVEFGRSTMLTLGVLAIIWGVLFKLFMVLAAYSVKEVRYG